MERSSHNVGNGAWELKARKKVLVGILHTDVVPMAWALGFRNLQIPGDVLPVAGRPYDDARNYACQVALDNDYEYVFMFDSDVVAPNDTILRLMVHNKPIISGVYYRRSPPSSVPVMIKHGQWVTDYPPNALIEVDWCGAGCLLIHRSLLECYRGRPGCRWFDWRVNYRGTGVYPDETCMSEDFTFMALLKRDYGIPTIVDTSIQCRHVGWGESRQGVPPGLLIPAEAIPNT